jgi:hypothetical protein
MTVQRTRQPLAGAAVIAVVAVGLLRFGGVGGHSPAQDRVVFVVVPEARWASMPPPLAHWAKASLALNSVPQQPARPELVGEPPWASPSRLPTSATAPS